MSKLDYTKLYTDEFFEACDGIDAWRLNKLKTGDALCGIAYAFGLSSVDAVRSILPFHGYGHYADRDNITAREQMARVIAAASRFPKGVLEIGPGRGEVSVSLAAHGIPVQAVDPALVAREWLTQTAERFYGRQLCTLPVRFIQGSIHEVEDQIHWNDIDTVMLVESLEHILAEHFDPFYNVMVNRLRESGGRLIIVNWLSHHPLGIGGDIHCRPVDDDLYDTFEKDARTVVYRNKSHLVLDY